MSVEALRAYAEGAREALGFPGLSVAVTDREGLLASEAFGLANLDAGTPVTRGTRFELGSIGKTFTATIALQLREEGLLDLDEPLTRYLPWFEVRSDHAPITIRHLLTHTSGLMTGAEQSSSSRYDVWALRDGEVGFPPGSRYLYSNVGYRTLGFVLEDVTETPYPELVRARILAPLGLEAVDPEIAAQGRRRLAVAYERLHDDRPARRSDPWVPAPWLETATGDGCLAGTMDDLAGFLRVLLNGGRGLLSPESFALMTAPAIEGDDGWWYGCGLELRGRLIRHGGSMPGFGTMMLGDLDSGLGVVVAVNATDDQDLTEGIAEALLDLYRDGTPPPVPTPPAVEGAADYAGAYEGEAGRFVVDADGDRLLLDGRPLELRRRERFVADRPDLTLFVLRFLRESGRVVAAVHGGDVYRREGVPPAPVPPVPAEWQGFTGHYRAYNPWCSNFRVVLRAGELLVIFPGGLELPLEPLPDGRFRAGEGWSPERLRFDALADGRALRATLSGEAYYRLP